MIEVFKWLFTAVSGVVGIFFGLFAFGYFVTVPNWIEANSVGGYASCKQMNVPHTDCECIYGRFPQLAEETRLWHSVRRALVVGYHDWRFIHFNELLNRATLSCRDA